jgi:sec-independent protein translocase protein TatA
MPIGPLELVIVLVIVLLIFGATRIPEVGRSLGTGMREFKDGILGRHDKADAPAELESSSAAEEGGPTPPERASESTPPERASEATPPERASESGNEPDCSTGASSRPS